MTRVVARESSTCCPPIPKEFTCRFTILGSCLVVLPPEPLPSALACWLAQPGIVVGAGTIADGIKSGSLRQCGVPRLPLGGRRIARAAGHRDPGDRIVPAIHLNGPAASRSVLAGPAVVPKLQMFGRSVLVADPKVQTLGRSVPAGLVVVPKLRMFGRGVLVRPQAFGLNGLPLAPRAQVVQHVQVVHKDLAMQLAPAVGIVTRRARVRANRRNNNPAMQLARAARTVTRLMRVRTSPRGNRHDKETRASAIALRREGDLGSSENAQCEPAAMRQSSSLLRLCNASCRTSQHVQPMSAFGGKADIE